MTWTVGLSAPSANTKLSNVVDMLEERDAIQEDLDGLERSPRKPHNMATSKVMHQVQGYPKHKYRLGDEWMDSSSVEDLGWMKNFM